MPNFEQGILSSHIGFNNGCLLINLLTENEEIFKKYIKKILLLQKQGQLSSTLNSNLNNSNSSFPSSSLSDQTIEFIGRQYNNCNPKPSSDEIIKVLSSCTLLNNIAIENFVFIFDKLNNVNIEIKSPSHLGEMYDLKWKLGVSISSSNCTNLSSPFVSISFKVRENNGSSTSHTAELTYSEFQDFLTTFRDISAVMDNL